MKVDGFLAGRVVLRPIPNFYIIVSLADALFALAGVPIFYGVFCLDLFFSVLLAQAVAKRNSVLLPIFSPRWQRWHFNHPHSCHRSGDGYDRMLQLIT